MKPQDVPQLDLFMDNTVVVTENQLRDALSSRQFDPARQQLTKLSKLNPEHPQLGCYQDLINYGRHCQSNSDIDQQQIAAEMAGLQQEVLPLARDVLGQSARDYIAFAWRRLADNMNNIIFIKN